jgi:hypothetical protein
VAANAVRACSTRVLSKIRQSPGDSRSRSANSGLVTSRAHASSAAQKRPSARGRMDLSRTYPNVPATSSTRPGDAGTPRSTANPYRATASRQPSRTATRPFGMSVMLSDSRGTGS